MKKLTIAFIAFIALSFAFPVLADENRNFKPVPSYNSAEAGVTRDEAPQSPQAPESPRSNGSGSRSNNSELKTKIALLEQIVALLQTLIQLRG